MCLRKTSLILIVALTAFFCVNTPGEARQAAGKSRPLTMTILYDNYPFLAGCETDWGFAALIEGFDKTILFDTGTIPEILKKNVEALKIDLAGIDLVVISHDHGDHTGGIPYVLRKKSGLPVYSPFSADPDFVKTVKDEGGRIIPVKEPQSFIPNVLSSGELGEAIHEQAVVLDTPRGLIVITGCAHPGIISILEKVKETQKKEIELVLGGFHLMQTAPAEIEKIIARFKELGIRSVGATHCTGDEAIGMFRKAFGPNFVELGVGRKIDLGGALICPISIGGLSSRL